MTLAFKIWDQANDGATMAIRAADTGELAKLAEVCVGEDIAGSWSNLQQYLDQTAQASDPPDPYVRVVDVLWTCTRIVLPSTYSQARRFRVTYTGRRREEGGFASQGYCVLDPAWNGALQPHHQEPISVEWHAGGDRDLIVVS